MFVGGIGAVAYGLCSAAVAIACVAGFIRGRRWMRLSLFVACGAAMLALVPVLTDLEGPGVLRNAALAFLGFGLPGVLGVEIVARWLPRLR